MLQELVVLGQGALGPGTRDNDVTLTRGGDMVQIGDVAMVSWMPLRGLHGVGLAVGSASDARNGCAQVRSGETCQAFKAQITW